MRHTIIIIIILQQSHTLDLIQYLKIIVIVLIQVVL